MGIVWSIGSAINDRDSGSAGVALVVFNSVWCVPISVLLWRSAGALRVGGAERDLETSLELESLQWRYTGLMVLIAIALAIALAVVMIAAAIGDLPR